MKQVTAERGLFARLATSTGAGELADTFLFCAIAASAIGITSMGVFWNYFVVGVIYKVAVELVVMPLTMVVIGWLKRHEPTYWAERGSSRVAAEELGLHRGEVAGLDGGAHVVDQPDDEPLVVDRGRASRRGTPSP